MAITREQIKAANKRGSAAIARGPVARAARYDARRALIVISLEGGCEFSFPTALRSVRTDWDCIGRSSMQTFTFQRSSKALSVHVDGCNISVSFGGSARSAAKAKASRENGTRGGRPKDKEAA